MTAPAIRTSHLARDYGLRRALLDFSFEAPRGRVVALLGPNGAGKTTLLRLLAGLIAPSGGTVEVLGASPRPMPPEVACRVAVMGEGHGPPTAATLAEAAALQAGASPKFDRAMFTRFCADRDLAPERGYGSLSKGQKRWALAGLMLASGADLILLDEPADGLDPTARRDLYNHLRHYATAHEATALVATHIISDVERVADDVAILHHGRLVLHAPLEDLRDEVREVELADENALPQLGEGVTVLAARREEGAFLAWVRCTAAGLAGLQARPASAGAVRNVDLETLYLAVTDARATAGLPLEKEA